MYDGKTKIRLCNRLFYLFFSHVHISWSFALCFTEALKCPDIQNLLKDITRPTHEELRDMFSAELHRQLQPLKEQIIHKDKEISELKKAVVDLRSELDQLEQHGRRDSLRFSGIPENPAHDNKTIKSWMYATPWS